VLSQQTFVVVPAISSVSMPRRLRWSSMADEPWMNALKRFFRHRVQVEGDRPPVAA
jgi:hypothetical protein